MSRIGAQPITIPTGVEVTFDSGILNIKGSKGELKRDINDLVKLTIADGVITLAPSNKTGQARAMWGTYASHIRNMITGVTEGFEKKLEIEGVGYRAEVQGNKVVLNVGFSHPVEKIVPEGVTVLVEKTSLLLRAQIKRQSVNLQQMSVL